MNLVQIRAPSTQASATGRLVDRAAREVRYVRISLTDRCNYRCTYCMPDRRLEVGPRDAVLSLEEVVRLAESFARWGVRRIRFTGGEPTLRRGLVDLVARTSRLRTLEGRRLEVVLTTNGERLASLAAPLHHAGLAGVTVSLDSLDPARFQRITRRGRLEAVLGGLEAARSAGFRAVRLNTVAVRGFNDDELGAIARYAWSRAAVPRFIEIMPMFGGELFVPGEFMSAAAVRSAIEQQLGLTLVPDDGQGVRGAGPASYWRVRSGPHAGGRLGTIAALTENFCQSCNRVRISATGQLHGCLARDEVGDLRGALRSNDPARVEAVVRHVLGTKRDAHGFKMDGTGGPHKAMISIGG
jgi:GTP 3',8-cyclase